MPAETSSSLATDAEGLRALETSLTARGETVGSLQSGSSTDIATLAEHWGGPRAIDVLTAAQAYVDALAPATGALESAASTVADWAEAAEGASASMARYEATLAWATDHSGSASESEASGYTRQAVRAAEQIDALRLSWRESCASFSAALADDITALYTASTTVITSDDASVLTDTAYFAKLAELTTAAGFTAAYVDRTGQFQSAIDAAAARLGSEDGALMFLVIESANQQDIGEADGNLSEDDILAARDPATVEALLRQFAAERGEDWDETQLDALVAEIVGTASMMHASEDEVWEDIDDDIEWYERGVLNWARENLLAPLASFTVGALCYTAAAGTATATGGVSLGAASYCGGLAAATYNATNSWAHGGGAGDVLDSFTDPRAWAIGAAEGFVFQGATNFLLRPPALPPPPVAAVDDALIGTLDDAATAATPSGQQYSVLHEYQLSSAEIPRTRDVHFRRGNADVDATFLADDAYAAAIEAGNPGIRAAVSSAGGRQTPTGWTWHHVPASQAQGRVGVMQLVPTEQHAPGSIFQQVLHPGGRGGYSEWAVPAGAPPNTP